MSTLLAQLEALNRPAQSVSRAQEISHANWTAAQREWHHRWAAKCREISHVRHANEAASNDAIVLAALRKFGSAVSTRDLAARIHRSQDWLRKVVLPRLVAQGLARAVTVTHPITGWPIRRDWEAL